MTFLGAIADVMGGVASLTRSEIGSLVSRGLSEGLSANTMLRSLVDAGSGIRRQSFLQLVGEVRAADAAAGEIAIAPVDEPLAEGLYTQWSGGATNTYLHRVSLFVRQEDNGVLEVMTKKFDILSTGPLSPAEAVERAKEIFYGNTGGDNYPGEELLGAELRGAYHQLGEG